MVGGCSRGCEAPTAASLHMQTVSMPERIRGVKRARWHPLSAKGVCTCCWLRCTSRAQLRHIYCSLADNRRSL